MTMAKHLIIGLYCPAKEVIIRYRAGAAQCIKGRRGGGADIVVAVVVSDGPL